MRFKTRLNRKAGLSLLLILLGNFSCSLSLQVVSHASKSYIAPQCQPSDYVDVQAKNCRTKSSLQSMKTSNDFREEEAWFARVTRNPKKSAAFSLFMTICGAGLGPFLDSYHSAFGVLQYNDPIKVILWGSSDYPGLTTTWWVPELFGLAGFIIGWLYILLDSALNTDASKTNPSPMTTFLGISIFTLQYWLSGILFQAEVDRSTIFIVMTTVSTLGFYVFDRTKAGFITSAATAIGGPLIEVGLISLTAGGVLLDGYHYSDLGETGFFPLWILPVYFLGGPANGNLARSFWNAFEDSNDETSICDVCGDTRRDVCPSCEGKGTYVAMGGSTVDCTSCKGRGFVICRACFSKYGEDPYDIDAIRELMSRMPD